HGAAASSGDEHRLRLLDVDGTDTYVDLGAPGLSQRELDTFHFEGYDSSGTNPLGYEDSQCAVGFVNQQDQTFTFDCSSDFVLPGGQIATVGHVDPSFSIAQYRHVLSAMHGNLQEPFAITG